MKKLLEFLVKTLVGQPEAVQVEENQSENGVITLLLQVAPEDMGKVIGKQGKIIKALRRVCAIRARKEGKKLNLQLLETPQ